MSILRPLKSIQARLAVLIVVAMAALVVLLVYQEISTRNDRVQAEQENLERLGTFAARAERERFDATERLLSIVVSAESLRNVTADPGNVELHDGCTRSLFIIDQLLPGTRTTLYDTNGTVLCSSRAAEYGEFSESNALWFRTAVERQEFSTGGFRVHPQTGEPGLNFGLPLKNVEGNTVAYLSSQVLISDTDELIEGESLPDTGRLSIVDAGGKVITSSSYAPGEELAWFPEAFGSLDGYLASLVVAGENRTGAGIRITDADDAAVTVVVSAETDALVAPLTETLFRELLPVAVVALITLIAALLLARAWVVQPVGALARASAALSRGELSARARVRGGVSEFEQLGAAFNDMAETRERASHAKDEFLGLVSHELKTPITTVLGNAEILRTRGDKVPADLRQVAFEDIHDNAIRLTSIIDNLLVLARLDRGAELEAEPLPLLRMAQVYAEEQARVAPARVSVRGDGTLLGMGGETYVEQVTRNLIGNALKYSPVEQPVEVIVEARGDMAVMRVLDRGPGIEKSERDAIFEPFYRSANTSAIAEGMGIGLSVCRRLIEAMGGTVWCRERDGGGSEFGFELPLAVEEMEPVPVLDEEPLVASATT